MTGRNYNDAVLFDATCVRDTEAFILGICVFYIYTSNHWTAFQVQPLNCGRHTSRRGKDLRGGTAQRPAEAPA